MKKITAILFLSALMMPLFSYASAEVEVLEGEVLNMVANSDVEVLNINLDVVAKPSDANGWGSNWGNKIPFKANVPHNIPAYGADVSGYFPHI